MPDYRRDSFKPGHKIETSEQARKWVLELTDEVEVARFACDMAVRVVEQQRAYSTWLLKQGSALGVLQTLHRVGLIPDAMAEELHERIKATMAPTYRSVRDAET